MHQKKKYNKRNQPNCWSLKKELSNYAVMLFTAVFFLQQLFAFGSFTLPPTFTSSVSVIKQQQNAVTVAEHVRAQLPHQSTPDDLEIEVETAEEDDTKNNFEEYCQNIAAIHAVEQQAYTSYLRSRYLQLASSVQNQPTVPFFILYHSWKNHLA